MAFEERIRQSLGRSQLLSGLDVAILHRLAAAMRPVALPRNQVLFMQQAPSDGCYCVLAGSLKVSRLNESGEEHILALLGSGDLIGEMGLIDGAPRSATVTALSAAELAFLSAGEFDRVAGRHPEIYRHLLRLLCDRLRATNQSFSARQTLPLAGRLAHALLRLADGFGKPLADGRIVVMHKITQGALADLSGARRENVSRQINGWLREGVLSRHGGYYCLERPAALRELAASD
jgi:CRP-like cAMP-binding protein